MMNNSNHFSVQGTRSTAVFRFKRVSMRLEYGARTLVTSAFGSSVFENHQTVLTASLARSLRLFTHSMGDGSLAGLYQKNSSASRYPILSHQSSSTRKL